MDTELTTSIQCVNSDTYIQETIAHIYFMNTSCNNNHANFLFQKCVLFIDFLKNKMKQDHQYYYHLLFLYKLIAQNRDCVFGKGERVSTYSMICAWYFSYPQYAINALYYICTIY